jgi:hypothetical protein
LVQDRVDIIDSIAEGTPIKVYFDLRGREWQGKYFTNLQAWRIEAAGGESKGKSPDGEFSTGTPYAEEGTAYDDLPF